jgi:imidazolonepropionase-like amidohydrolase/predicted enzyme related to lactoylglutathione lyase
MIIQNARVIVGNGEVLPSASVVIEAGRILEVSTQAVESADDRVIDAAGKSLMPGLIDTHLHIFYSFEKGEPVYRAMLENQAPAQMTNFLKAGVTTIKSMNDPLDIVLELRQRLRDGKIQGPRLLTVGPDFTAPDGHPAITLCAGDPWLRSQMVVEADDPEQARQEVRRLAAAQVDAIKLIYQGGEMDTFNSRVTLQKLPAAVMQAVIDEAHRQCLRATVHVWYEPDAIEALEAGADGLEHVLVGVDLSDYRLVQLFQEQQAFYVPTLQVMGLSANKELLPTSMRNLKVIADEGVRIALGTDMHCAFQTGGLMEIEELELMQKAGLSAGQVIVAATRNAAEHLGLLAELGTVEAGKLADLILVDGDPSRDISEIRKVAAVFQAGEIVYEAGQPESAARSRNVVSWFDIPVNDIERARAFYEAALGIQLMVLEFGEVKFALFPDRGEAGGAAGWLIQSPHNQPSGQGTVVYFEVQDIDGCLSRVPAAGGRASQPKFKMGQLGCICLIQDSEGNTIGLRDPR